jgi:predicted DNA-binding antitoxin AbrB/MazE fold protein
MPITVKAIYEDGVLKPKQPLALQEGAEVELSINGTEETPILNVPDEIELAEGEHPLDAVLGICKEGPDISLAERHDEIIYGGLLRKEPRQP